MKLSTIILLIPLCGCVSHQKFDALEQRVKVLEKNQFIFVMPTNSYPQMDAMPLISPPSFSFPTNGVWTNVNCKVIGL